MTIQADMQVNIDEFLRFADYFFDGLFADWAVMDEISNAQQNVKKTQSQITSLIDKLQAMHDAAEREQAKLQNELDQLVLTA